MTEQLPLQGVRVADFTQAWAGPFAALMLADFGAEVIRIESPQRPDYARFAYLPAEPGDAPPEDQAGYHHWISRNKLALALEVTHPRGREVALQLIEKSDILLENFSRRAMPKLGLDWEDVQPRNPRLIYVRLRALNSHGPYQDYVAYGEALEAFTGLDAMQGYPDRGPRRSGVIYTDPIASYHAVLAAMAALRLRRETGRGQLIEVSERDATVRTIGEAVLAWSADRWVQPILGNRSPFYARGCYRCAGEDRWLAVSFRTDEHWRRACTVMGRRELAADPRFATNEARLANHDALDAVVTAWTAARDYRQAMGQLQEAGVPAGAVLSPPAVLEDPHFRARGFFEEIDHPAVGKHPHPGFPYKFSRTPLRVRRPAPRWGEHDDYVLWEVLGYSAEEVADLRREGVIGRRPVGSPVASRKGRSDGEKAAP